MFLLNFHKITTQFGYTRRPGSFGLLNQMRCAIFAPSVISAGVYKNGAIRNNIEETAF